MPRPFFCLLEAGFFGIPRGEISFKDFLTPQSRRFIYLRFGPANGTWIPRKWDALVSFAVERASLARPTNNPWPCFLCAAGSLRTDQSSEEHVVEEPAIRGFSGLDGVAAPRTPSAIPRWMTPRRALRCRRTRERVEWFPRVVKKSGTATNPGGSSLLVFPNRTE
jgi:hypothetical protein